MIDTQLPRPEPTFGGKSSKVATESTPERSGITLPPEGAPNVVLVMLDVGRSTGTSVGRYPVISRFTGTIQHIDVEVLSDMNAELAAAFGAGQARGALAQQ